MMKENKNCHFKRCSPLYFSVYFGLETKFDPTGHSAEIRQAFVGKVRNRPAD